ncbi:MAG: dicarboxylate/amino acid:cation symporter [Clostridiaceae bacterium]|nr:dicarboxylate/amino acid:cation symporter [Clostridiaceae bacterium]
MKKLWGNLPFRLLLGVIIGILVGRIANEDVMHIVVTVKYVLGQLITFCVPLIIIGFIAPSITKLGRNASRILGVAVIGAYMSSVGAALFSMGAGYGIIPHLSIVSEIQGMQELPEIIFKLDIPQIMGVMSALALSILIGLAATWVKAEVFMRLLDEFQKMVLVLVTRVVIPMLPFFIAFTFCALSYEGAITKQLPVFFKIVVIVIIGHYLWLALLYAVGGIYSRTNPWNILRNYGPAYLTAIGTMSSAATLAVALRCAKKSEPYLRSDMADFGIPLFANIHLCGSVLTEVFFVMTVSQILYGEIPELKLMVLFCILLGVFAIGAPGVPGGTVMASLGLITGVLGFTDSGTALMLTIFALQDSFGTACNIAGDGALTMILTGYANRHGIEEQKFTTEL